MRPTINAVVLSALLVTVWPASGAAQTASPPDFSGKWSLVAPGQPGPEVWLSSPLRLEGTITQDGVTFTVNRSDGALTYRLDGSESQRTSTSPGGITFTTVSNARWVSNALVITESWTTGTGGRWQDMFVCSFDASGNLVVVSIATPKTQRGTMITRMLTYKKTNAGTDALTVAGALRHQS
jgi:hypothetical protein